MNPSSPSAPAKLRLVYECAPLALIIEVGACGWQGSLSQLCEAPGVFLHVNVFTVKRNVRCDNLSWLN